MPLLIAIDISLSNLMPMGPLTNTQKTHTLPSFYIQYDMMEIFFATVTFISCPLALHHLREEAPAAGCLGGLGYLAHTRAPLARLYLPAQD